MPWNQHMQGNQRKSERDYRENEQAMRLRGGQGLSHVRRSDVLDI